MKLLSEDRECPRTIPAREDTGAAPEPGLSRPSAEVDTCTGGD